MKDWEIENKIQIEIDENFKKKNNGFAKEFGDKRKLNILTKSLADCVRSFGKY